MKNLLLEHLRNHRSSWSLGTFGALGEFLWDQNETLIIAPDDHLTVATDRGALRVDNLNECSAIAYETSRRHRDHWSQAVAFCLPETSATMNERLTITELGTDQNSILENNREATLFDLGLNTPYVDVCIRTSNPDLMTSLRALEGTNILAQDSPAFNEILRHHPHRVFISRIGRLEVFQPIGIEKTPEGPHTHILPKLLSSGLHHAANTPIPKDMIAGLMLYPSNPCVDIQGKEQAFDHNVHRAFQTLLNQHGLSDYVDEKQKIMTAIENKTDVENYPQPASKLRRLAARIALRQCAHLMSGDHVTNDSGLTYDAQSLQSWRTRFDRPETKPSSEQQAEFLETHK